MAGPATVEELGARAASLNRYAARLRASCEAPLSASWVDDASSNLSVAARWLRDPTLGSNPDGLVWVGLLLTIAERRLERLSPGGCPWPGSSRPVD